MHGRLQWNRNFVHMGKNDRLREGDAIYNDEGVLDSPLPIPMDEWEDFCRDDDRSLKPNPSRRWENTIGCKPGN